MDRFGSKVSGLITMARQSSRYLRYLSVCSNISQKRSETVGGMRSFSSFPIILELRRNLYYRGIYWERKISVFRLQLEDLARLEENISKQIQTTLNFLQIPSLRYFCQTNRLDANGN